MSEREEGSNNLVPFIEYIRPDGKQRSRWLEVDGKSAILAHQCIAWGARFTSELLPADLIALTCEYADDDLVLRIAQNRPDGEDLRAAAKSLIEAAYNLIEKKED